MILINFNLWRWSCACVGIDNWVKFFYVFFVPYVMCACLLPHIANSVRRRLRIYKWWQSDIKFIASPTFTTPPSPTAAAAPWIKFTLGNQMLSVSQEVLCCTEFNWLLCEWMSESVCAMCAFRCVRVPSAWRRFGPATADQLPELHPL